MATDSPEGQSPIPTPRPDVPPTPSGFGRLAARIVAWTSNLILSVVVIVAGMAFGRQVLVWWRVDPATHNAPPPFSLADGLADPAVPHTVHVGDTGWAIHLRSVRGDTQAALRAMHEACREAIRGSGLPPGPQRPEERQFLANLKGRQPIEEQPGQWRLYEMRHLFPLAVGVRTVAGKSTSPGGETVAENASRVVTWGLVVPAGKDAWTVYVFFPSAAAPGEQRPLDVPLPPGSKRLLAVGAASGSAVTAFRSSDPPSACAEFYSRWFAQNGWREAAAWRQSDQTWNARFLPANASPNEAVDVRLGVDDKGQTSGILLVTEPSKR